MIVSNDRRLSYEEHKIVHEKAKRMILNAIAASVLATLVVSCAFRLSAPTTMKWLVADSILALTALVTICYTKALQKNKQSV